MDLSKMLNNDEASSAERAAASQRPKLDRAYTADVALSGPRHTPHQMPHLGTTFDNSGSVHQQGQFAPPQHQQQQQQQLYHHDQIHPSSHQYRSGRPPPPLHTSSYNGPHSAYPALQTPVSPTLLLPPSSATADGAPSHQHPPYHHHASPVATRTAHATHPPHEMSFSPSAPRPYPLPPTGSPAISTAAGTPYQPHAAVTTPGSRMSLDYPRPSSHASSGSSHSHSHAAVPHLGSPISARSTPASIHPHVATTPGAIPPRPSLVHRQSSGYSNYEASRLHEEPRRASLEPPLHHSPASAVPQVASAAMVQSPTAVPHELRNRPTAHRDREGSMDVSPKTIPRMPPTRQDTTPSRQSSISYTSPAQPVQAYASPAGQPPVTPVVSERNALPVEGSQRPKRPLEDDTASANARSGQPPPKKRRHQTVPIWAQPAKQTRPLSETARRSGQAPPTRRARPPLAVNGSSHGHPTTAVQPTSDTIGTLGPWEKSFTNVEPLEEITKAIADFLFEQVVMRQDLAVGPAGASASPAGQLEIEAKIGTIIDTKTAERLQLPIQTEAILRDQVGISFESAMTEAQHAKFNEMLNDAVKTSLSPPEPIRIGAPGKRRIPIQYVHTRETDRFYKLPRAAMTTLPAYVRQLVNPAHNLSVRVSTDPKTGAELAKIVKVRIADLHVYSPRTQFDWRVSVSVEVDWPGDVEALGVGDATGGGRPTRAKPDRNKDRMSYRHLAYQIDLTQVKPSGADGGPPSHELEVEIASAAVREQGTLARDSKPNQYMDLVKTFADNVRLLVRRG